MKNLFTYGTLMFSDVIHRIVHKKYPGQPAVVKGFKRTQIIGDVYPVAIPQNGACVEGVIYLNVNQKDCLRLDAFEGEYYQRIKTQAFESAKSEHPLFTCELYVLKAKYYKLASKKHWNPEAFSKNFIQSFTKRYPTR